MHILTKTLTNTQNQSGRGALGRKDLLQLCMKPPWPKAVANSLSRLPKHKVLWISNTVQDTLEACRHSLPGTPLDPVLVPATTPLFFYNKQEEAWLGHRGYSVSVHVTARGEGRDSLMGRRSLFPSRKSGGVAIQCSLLLGSFCVNRFFSCTLCR